MMEHYANVTHHYMKRSIVVDKSISTKHQICMEMEYAKLVANISHFTKSHIREGMEIEKIENDLN